VKFNENCYNSDSCCSGIEPRSPRYNRPGLSQIAYRLDTHAGFMRRMLAGIQQEKPSKSLLEDLPGLSPGLAEKLHEAGLNNIHSLAGASPDELSACANIEISLARKLINEAIDKADMPARENGPLYGLTTYAKDDPAIAILDACSCIADILTFYQEKIANEGFLRTAAERRSIMFLAKALGYRLKPGMASSTFLVFTVDDAPGSPRMVDVPAGTKVQSIPAPGDLPQTFETMISLKARVEWNLIRPKLTEAQIIGPAARELLLKGLNLNLMPGDVILLLDEERERDPESDAWEVRTLSTVLPRPEWNATLVTWAKPLERVGKPRIYVMRERASLFGYNAPEKGMIAQESESGKPGQGEAEGDDQKIPSITRRLVVDLDSVYSRVLPGSWIVLSDPSMGERVFSVKKAYTVFRNEFTLRSKITCIETDTQKGLAKFSIRDTTVFIYSDPLTLAEVSKEMFLEGREIEFEQFVPDMKNGQTLIVSGKSMRAKVKRADLKLTLPDGARRMLNNGASVRILSKKSDMQDTAEISWTIMDGDGYVGEVNCSHNDLELMPALNEDDGISEAITIKTVLNRDGRTVVLFDEALKNSYDRTTVTIHANIVGATHGDTIKEILGSGDSTKVNQQFLLKKVPLFIPGPHGTDSTLEVAVNDVIWKETQSFHYMDAASQKYIVDIDDDGRAKIIFGDGKNGARLPSGVENVSAKYRWGVGTQGSVPSDSLSLLKARPMGIRNVTNPMPAGGGQPQESISSARINAPLAVLTFDRIVSIKDYEDFSHTFPGIGKAKVRMLPARGLRIVHITVAASDGTTLDPESELLKSLRAAIDRASNCFERVMVSSFELKTFSVDAGILVEERYNAQKVLEEVKAVLNQEFSFDRRDLGQHVYSSEVVECMHRVEGVVAVDLNKTELDPKGRGVKIQRPNLEQQIEVKSDLKQLLPPTSLFGPREIDRSGEPELACILRSEPARIKRRDAIEEIIPAELLLINSSPSGIVLRDLRA
jgi:hypothetical protein